MVTSYNSISLVASVTGILVIVTEQNCLKQYLLLKQLYEIGHLFKYNVPVYTFFLIRPVANPLYMLAQVW